MLQKFQPSICDEPFMGLPPGWIEFFQTHNPDLLARLLTIEAALAQRIDRGEIFYPEPQKIFTAFQHCSPQSTRVILFGQDAYHNTYTDSSGRQQPNATGLSFSVPDGAKIPASLRNIFKEYASDLGAPIPRSGNLQPWAEQGVLMLNAVPTVTKGIPKSHSNVVGWEFFSQGLIRAISTHLEQPLVFLLWGNDAKALEPFICNEANRHLIIKTSHPSPIGGSCNKGFFNHRPFTRINTFFQTQGLPPVDWMLGSEPTQSQLFDGSGQQEFELS
jgi:uracil-DNA glycosylase